MASKAFYYLSSALLVVVIPCAVWMWPNAMSTLLVKIRSTVRCEWLGYNPEEGDDHDASEELILQTKDKKQRAGSVADLAAKFEQTAKPDTPPKKNEEEQHLISDLSRSPSSCSQKAFSGASLLLGLVSGLTSGPSSSDNLESTAAEDKTTKKSPTRVSFTASSNERCCRICDKKIFPTDESTTARNNTYHVGCFRCSLCASKLKNHPDEEHKLVAGMEKQPMILQCRQCKIDNEHKNKPRRKSRVAGEKIVVEDSEQGDIDQVVDAIGDDLEEAMWGMIPRCAICGGDFLSYAGDISMVGSLKYHKECFLMGKPGAGSGSLTLDPVQAARYLPDNFILKLSTKAGKTITTLFFVWKDKEPAIRTMRLERKGSVSVVFDLDDEARANPNYKGKSNAQKKTTVPLPPMEGDQSTLSLDLVGAEQTCPEPPILIEPVSIIKGHQKPSILQATTGYSKYSLDHSLKLTIPLNWECDTLGLLGATLTVDINESPA